MKPFLIPQTLIWVLADGNGWIAVEKPAGMSVHNNPGQDVCSIVGTYIQAQPNIDFAFGLHPVHRLDKDTSGVLLLAFDSKVLTHYARQFEMQRVKKQYIAVLHGQMQMPETSWGLWDWPLSKNAGGRNNAKGKGKLFPCRTQFCIKQHTPHYTLVQCKLLTGRKHQIRRHARLAGHAVVGDSRYGTPRSVNYLKKQGFDRLGLHADYLEIHSPENVLLKIQSRKTPAPMQRLLDQDG